MGFIVPPYRWPYTATPARPGEYSTEVLILLVLLCFDIRMAFLLHLVPLHNAILEYLQGYSLVTFPLVIRVAEVQEALGS